jgi:hypothetical protein
MFQTTFIDFNDHEWLFYIKYLYYCNPFSRKMETLDLIFLYNFLVMLGEHGRKLN